MYNKIFICIFSFITLIFTQQRSNIAVMDLSSNTLNKSVLRSFSSRLRAELFDTEKFTVLERSEMKMILEEQQFQRSDCVDAMCAVEAGQLLGVHYMVIGNIDSVGSLFSVNIRQVDVGTAKIVNAVREDCRNCTVEDVVLTMMKIVAHRLAGLKIDEEQTINYARIGSAKIAQFIGYTGGTSGNLDITLTSEEAELFIDGHSYGKGSKLIRKVPPGKHIITTKHPFYPAKKKRIRLVADQILRVKIKIRDRIVHLVILPKWSYRFPRESFYGTFSGQGIKIESGIKIKKHYIGVAFNGVFLKADKPEFEYLDQRGTRSLGTQLIYMWDFFSYKDYLRTSIGGNGGFRFDYFNSDKPDSIGTCDYTDGFWGGPKVSILVGYKKIFFDIDFNTFFGKSFIYKGMNEKILYEFEDEPSKFIAFYELDMGIMLLF